MEGRNQLFAALSNAQVLFPAIPKNREVVISTKSGGKYKFRYADLESILSATRPALASNKLALTQIIQRKDEKTQVLLTVLGHADGGTLESEIELPAPSSFADPKELGAAITYLRRYAVSALLGVAADDDLDQGGESFKETEAEREYTDGAIKRIDGAENEEKAKAVFKEVQEELADNPLSYARARSALQKKIQELRGGAK